MTVSTLNQKILDTLRFCTETGRLPNGTRACLLCGDTCLDEPMFTGMLVAGRDMSRRLGCSEERMAAGGGRVVIYQLCQDCFDRPNSADEVDARILKRASVQ
jgi:hypothetical protein